MERTLPQLLTLKDASEQTGINIRTLRGWQSNDRSFPAVKIRGRVFVRKNEFNRWLRMNSEPAILSAAY
jgi:predicted site-specific integrase-resolvase